MNRYIYNNVLRGCAVMAFMLTVLTAAARDVPTISPVMTVTEAPDDDSGQTADGSQTTSYTGSAPVTVRCESGAGRHGKGGRQAMSGISFMTMTQQHI